MTALIYCAVLEDELEAIVASSPAPVRLHKMPQGLHQDPPRLQRELQAAIDAFESDPQVDTIVLGYGLCSRGTEGLRTARCTVVLPRAHDCITLLLGSRERYAQESALAPGTYWYSPGWNRHHIPPGEERYVTLLRQYQAQFGDEDAEYLMEEEQKWFKTYDRAAFVHQSLGDVDPARTKTQDCATWLGWRFAEIEGDPALLRELVFGPWSPDRFAVAKPGESLKLSGDDRIVEVVDAD